MRAFVFTDESLASHAGRYVWLEIDTEKAQNAAVRNRLQVRALPTFVVVDAKNERVALRWVGSANVAQLVKLLDEGERAVTGTPPTAAAPAGAADLALARADSLYGAGDDAGAAQAYAQALEAAPEAWPAYGRAVESRLFALQTVKAYEEGVRLAREALPRLRHTPSAASVAASGLDCALSLPADHPGRAELLAALAADAREVAADTTLGCAADDRSGVYITLLDALHEAQDEAGAKQVAAEWAAFLEREAARATTPEARAVFDSHRLSAYLELGQPERALPMLEASERDLPGDYNPPARLAVAYRAMKRWDDALAASDRALANAYGPRKLSILQVRADLYLGRGDKDAARSTLQSALALADSLPPGQRSEATIAALRKRLADLE
jgi:tetratricopeptide (TPR) repeat protein